MCSVYFLTPTSLYHPHQHIHTSTSSYITHSHAVHVHQGLKINEEVGSYIKITWSRPDTQIPGKKAWQESLARKAVVWHIVNV